MEIVEGIMQVVEERRRLCLQIVGSWATRHEHLALWATSPCGYPVHWASFRSITNAIGPYSDPLPMLLGLE
ncbi:hypothetical protein A2U01_0086672 [Trifolium medium]|uniref:Uncharacterized protein n=1 Tax=Trifolium medium TaxID=97028 RepID=A0A392TXJ9_9FABA|nr:hypothetical protein [Trifolium medium]